MAHLASVLFFMTLLVTAAASLSVLFRAYEAEIVAALRGERPVRGRHVRWTGARVRTQVRSAAYLRSLAQPLRAAS